MFPTRDRIRRNRRLDEFQAPLGDVLGAVAEDTWARSPYSSGQRAQELLEANYGKSGFWNLVETGEFISDPDSPVVSADDARRRIGEEGLDLSVPDSGIRQRALDILIERKKDERRRQDTLSRSASGFQAGSLKLATALGVSLLDPLNVAASFVPIVGPGRYGAMLSRAAGSLGRAGVRARVGIVEGVAGQALVEPIVYGAARQEQADYGLADSFINVTFGGVLGGGLHVGGGAIADAISRGRPLHSARPVDGPELISDQLSPDGRAALLRAAVAQAVEGKVTRIDGLMDVARQSARGRGLLPDSGIRADGPTPLASSASSDSSLSVNRTEDLGVMPTGPDGTRVEIGGGTVPDRGVAVANVLRDGKVYIGNSGDLHFNLMERYGTPERGEANFVGFINPEGRIMDRQEAFRWVADNEVPVRASENMAGHLDAIDYREQVTRDRQSAPAPETGPAPIAGDAVPTLSSATADDGPRLAGRIDRDMTASSKVARDLPGSYNPMDRLRDDARASLEVESTRLADMDAARRGDAQLAAMKSDELARITADADQAVSDMVDTARVLGIDDASIAAVRETDDLAIRAQEYGRAVRAAAECSLRRGI